MWIEIFRSGNHSDSKGKKANFSDSDLEEISAKYNSSISEDESLEAPLVKGHPKSDEPAYGWIEKLSAKGNRLLAKLKDVSPELIKEVRDGLFKKVSIALYPDKMLRHVGLLGAWPPAVKGLKSLSFSKKDDFRSYEDRLDKDIDNYSELIEFNEELTNEISTLEQEKQELLSQIKSQKREMLKERYHEFTKGLSQENGIYLTPAIENDLIDLMIEFEEKYAENEYSSRMQKIITGLHTSNILERNLFDFTDSRSNEFEDKNVDEERLTLHNKAVKILSENPTFTYEEAVSEASL